MQSARILWRVPQVSTLRPGQDARTVMAFAALIATFALTGCGMPGAPLPPSLNLPVPVTDLSAVRTGGQVALVWTMPTKTTDKVLLKGNIAVRVCRNQAADQDVPSPQRSNSLPEQLPPLMTRFFPNSPLALRVSSRILSSSSIAKAVPPDFRTALRLWPARRHRPSKT